MSKSYSSHGEDSVFIGILKRAGWLLNKNLLNEPKYYIDIGCFHPINDSNTYALYELGWNGILIDPNPSIENLIKNHRPRDIFLNLAITENDNQLMNYYLFDENASSNTLDKTFADWISKSQNIPIKQVFQVKTSKLDTIVELFEKDIFLLNIDVEGLDAIILQNYSWKKRPTFIWVEDWNHKTKKQDDQIIYFLINKQYKPIANVYLTTLYLDINSDIYNVLC